MAGTRAYIGIGSNLDQPIDQVSRAFRALEAIPQTHCVARSPLYRSEPLGPPDQPEYINAVACLETELKPETLLVTLQVIENAQGRVRTLHWGPRTLDLDILLYGNLIRTEPALILPHPRMHERAFVLYPLHDVAPDLTIPGLGSVKTLIKLCPPLGLARLG
jgi:2-amino-4-hydroxy-6-hydroxymethyldihydropteridine diphosphokinase